jgi:outer membrane protein assembly factor BamB
MRWFRTLAVILLGGGLAAADDWPHWLGPNRDGGTAEKVAPWKKAPKAAWRFAVGPGFSAPVVADGRVFIHAQIKEKEQEEVIALDAKTGRKLWRKKYDRAPFQSVIGSGPRATPAVFLDHVYTYGITGLLTCFEAKTGKQMWQVDTYKKFKAKLPRYGVCCSPLIEGNRLVVSVGGKGTAFVAFDIDNGEVLWKGLDEPPSTTSPVVVTYNPRANETRRDVVFMSGKGLVGVNPVTGNFCWDYAVADRPFGSTPTPACVDNLIVTSSMKHGAIAVRLTREKDRLTASPAWKNAKLTCSFSTPVVVGKDQIYLVTSVTSPEVTSTLRCVDLKTGKELWNQPKVGKHHAGLLRTGDNKLLMLTEDGTLKLLQANRKAYRELAKAKVCGPTFVAPALAGGRLYVRDGDEVVCLKLAD